MLTAWLGAMGDMTAAYLLLCDFFWTLRLQFGAVSLFKLADLHVTHVFTVPGKLGVSLPFFLCLPVSLPQSVCMSLSLSLPVVYLHPDDFPRLIDKEKEMKAHTVQLDYSIAL